MKTLNWSGFSPLPRGVVAPDAGLLTRLVVWLTRRESPVDGLEGPAKEPDPDRNPEPVRWGNFR